MNKVARVFVWVKIERDWNLPPLRVDSHKSNFLSIMHTQIKAVVIETL